MNSIRTGHEEHSLKMIILYIAYIIIGSASVYKAEAVAAEDDNLFESSVSNFGHSIYDVMRHLKGNILVSPLSLSYALTELAFAANGLTRREIHVALFQQPSYRDKIDDTELIESCKEFTNSLKDDKHLTIATQLFVDKDVELKKAYLNFLAETFNSTVGQVDFASKTEEARQEINKWVDSKTNHLIPEILEKGTISGDTASVLVNALHFKSAWVHPFRESATKKQTFYGLDKEYQVDMMFIESVDLMYKFDLDLNAEVLVLPYEGGYSFIIVLPESKKKIMAVELRLFSRDHYLLSEISYHTEKRRFNVRLPKFKFEQLHELKKTLQELGIETVFTNHADLGKLTSRPLKVDNIHQKTFIKVDEKGTEAAASTAVDVVLYSEEEPQEFIADHPFLFIIRNDASKVPVFIGRLSEP